jgi:hypothetical protein
VGSRELGGDKPLPYEGNEQIFRKISNCYKLMRDIFDLVRKGVEGKKGEG